MKKIHHTSNDLNSKNAYKTLSSLEESQDISLYFHIPFCTRKCPYCHFFVLPDQPRFKEPFVQALQREWMLRCAQTQGRRIVSIYFGGGTPTKLAPSVIESLLDTIQREAHVDPYCEITLEANPEDITYESMFAYKRAGVNRVSIGVQSLIDAELNTLNRQHTAQEAIHSIHECYRAGLSNISIDLMFELPFQTLDTWKRTLDQVRSLPVTHLSLYNLTFEPHTVFFKRRNQLEPAIVDDAQRLAMLQCAISELEAMGLKRYEISAFAHPGRHSRHNTGYWLARPFLGLGPSAFSYWDGKRFSNAKHFQRYIEALQQGMFPVDFEESLPFPRNLQELLAVELRLMEGVSLPIFQSRHGSLPAQTQSAIDVLIARHWLKNTQDRMCLTEEGLLFYDSVAAELME